MTGWRIDIDPQTDRLVKRYLVRRDEELSAFVEEAVLEAIAQHLEREGDVTAAVEELRALVEVGAGGP
jgi:hypothetical protein